MPDGMSRYQVDYYRYGWKEYAIGEIFTLMGKVDGDKQHCRLGSVCGEGKTYAIHVCVIFLGCGIHLLSTLGGA